ncbi:MAG: Crp/Fnr family transcriptional regulator [Vulcanimicrobiota bacterium]
MPQWENLGREKSLQAGEVLWSQGDPAGLGAFLLDGILGVEKVTETGDRIVFTELQKGAVLGEMSCLDGRPHSATVKSLSSARVRLFTSQELSGYLSRHPDQVMALLVKQNERLRALTEKLLSVGTQSVQRRLAYWLCERAGGVVSITHHELAAQLATTRESVSKALGKLRRLKLVSSGRGTVEVLDARSLAEMASSPL